MTCMNSNHWNLPFGYDPDCTMCRYELTDEVRNETNRKNPVALQNLLDIADQIKIKIPDFVREEAEKIIDSVIMI